MKVCIYGAGAIGGFLGTRLGAQGHAVAAVARGATLAALHGRGMRLRMGGTETTVPVTATEDARALGVQDLVIVSVKEPAMRAVAAGIAPLLGGETLVMTAMNGVPWWFFSGMPGRFADLPLNTLDPEGAIAAAIPLPHVIGCVVHASCHAPEPGVVQHVKDQRLIIGEPEGTVSARAAALARDLLAAGFDCHVSERIQQDVWYKLWGNMTINPLSAIAGVTVDRILADPLAIGFCRAVMEEARRVGAAIGCPIAETAEDRIEVARRLGSFKTSMLQDVEAGKPIELDALLTVVREIAERANVSTPSLDALLGTTRVFARQRGLYPST